jgi:hypothetical protein
LHFINNGLCAPLMPGVMRLFSGEGLSSLMRIRWLLLATIVLLFVGCYSKADERDALKTAAKIHSQMQNGDFSGIRREASPSFRQGMDESTFVSTMQQIQKDYGVLRKWIPIAYQSGVDTKAGKNYTLVFDVEFERGRSRERLVFVRSASGQMELWDITMEPLP